MAFLNNVNILSLNICSSHIYKLYHCPSTCPLQQYSSMLSPSSLSHGYQPLACYLGRRFFFLESSILQSETLANMALGPATRQTPSLCLQLRNNRRPPVFTKCLFNESCYVSSLSRPLMAPVLLQVPQRCWNIWRWKHRIDLNTHIISHPHARLQTLHIWASLCF